MRIAYIITWNLGHNDGVTRKVLRQAKEWKDLGHQVEIFCATEEIVKPVKGVTFFKKDRVYFYILSIWDMQKEYQSIGKKGFQKLYGYQRQIANSVKTNVFL